MKAGAWLAIGLAVTPAAAWADTSTPSLAERITWVVRNTDIATRAVADISDEEITWVVPFLVRRSPAGHAWGWFRSEGLGAGVTALPPPVAKAAPASPEPAKAAAAPVPPHLSSIEYFEVDCVARSMKLISAKYAVEHNLRGASQAVRGADLFEQPAPGSSAERKLATICSPTLDAADPAIADLRDTLTKIGKAAPAKP